MQQQQAGARTSPNMMLTSPILQVSKVIEDRDLPSAISLYQNLTSMPDLALVLKKFILRFELSDLMDNFLRMPIDLVAITLQNAASNMEEHQIFERVFYLLRLSTQAIGSVLWINKFVL
jgi:hypothetical protein